MNEEDLIKIKDASINSQLLYAIATGDTSGIDDIKVNTVNAMLLKYIVLNGGIGGGAFIKVGDVTGKSELPTTYTGSKGDYYLDTSTNNWWVWNGKEFYERIKEKNINISSILQTTTSTISEGENIVTCTLTDGTKTTFIIKNGAKGDTGDQGIQGEKGDAGYTPVKGVDYFDGDKGDKGDKGDTGISLDDVKLVKDITDKTNHLQVKFDNETSYTDLGRVQGKSNYEIALDNGFVGNEDEYLKSLTAQATESKIVTSKPRIEDDTTALGVWYYWQDNKEGTTDTAYKYRLDIPSTQDLGHGKYCFYYNLKWFTSETTQDVKALTNKDTYKYYLVMDLLDVSFDIIQETIADGTTTVLEHVIGDVSTTAPTSDYTPISSSTLSMLGVQCQTLYIGATKETANEVTIRTGTDVKGFITSGSFQSIIGNKSDLSTLNNDNIVSAINEIKSDLDEHTNDTDIHITSAERTKWNEVDNKVNKTDIADNLTSTDTNKPLSANQGKVLKGEVDLKANDDEVVKKTDITTTINSSSTDTQIPSALALYNKTKNMCTTSVANVAKTNITYRVLNATVNSGGGVSYSVKNGICYVQFASVTTTATSSGQYILSTGTLPLIDNSLSNGHYPIASANSSNGLVVVEGNTGGMRYYGGAMTIFTTISYPVKES